MTLGYEGLAVEVYDFDKAIGKSFGDVEFYRARLEGLAGPVLEPAVGNGRMMIPLIEAGFEVDGFDASPQMLARCEANCRARALSPRLEVARFTDFDFGRRYGALVVPVSSFMLIETFDDGLVALRRFADHLEPGGRLLVDLEPPSTPSRNVGERSWTLPDGDLVTLQTTLAEHDRLAQRTTSLLRYQRWRDGRLVDTTLQRFALRTWGVGEFRLALEAAGFTGVTVSGNYRAGRPLREGDAVMTFEAVRA